MEKLNGIKGLIAYIHDFYCAMGELGDVTLDDITKATFTFTVTASESQITLGIDTVTQKPHSRYW